MVFRLDNNDPSFPDPELADDDGLLAVGGDLSIECLLLAYSKGIFPWYAEGDPICWYAPHKRFVLYPSRIRVSKSMRKVIERGNFTITFNSAFDQVISQCASPRRDQEEGTWISAGMIAAYTRLHRAGYAHSVEAWQNGSLVGGLYGVKVNKVFCGESMFSTVSNASKAALIWLCENYDIRLVDCQVYTAHLESMVADFIPASRFLEELQLRAL
jgi:leucyl/phenylalanyl-tRNA--protein transferase